MQNPHSFAGVPPPGFPPMLFPTSNGMVPRPPPGLVPPPFGVNPMFAPGGVRPLLAPAAVPPLTASKPDSTEQSQWSEHRTPDGRIYYFNKLTNQSSWEKPEDLKKEPEQNLETCPWKEYKTEDGKVYYHNIITKQSSWTIPKELEEIRNKSSENKKNEKTFLPTRVEPQNTEVSLTPPQMSVTNNNTPSLADSCDNSNSNSNLLENLSSESNNKTKTAAFFSDKDFQNLTKAELLDYFKEILREKNISSSSSWENALKNIGNDPRFERFRTHPERKQFFNDYKVQRMKEEKEEVKNKIKKAKEQLETFLKTTDRMNSMINYRYACDLFRDNELWKLVPETDRREIFEECVHELAKKEREEAKQLRKRNMRVLSDIMDSMMQITYSTSWQEAQQLLLDNQTFAQDQDLLAMDKEDALIVFQEHIRQLEKEEEKEKLHELKIQERNQRLNREAFLQLLDELHHSGTLNSLSKWATLYHKISTDPRFELMLSQYVSGSTPLDLFKIYVEDLKARYEDEKHIIKEIIKTQNIVITPNMEYSEFVNLFSEDARSANLDAGNVKLVFEKLLTKEREKYREEQKEKLKSRKKRDSEFLLLLSNLPFSLDENSTWDDVRPHIQNKPAFDKIESEKERIELFDAAMKSMMETCQHHHNKTSQQGHRCAHSGSSKLRSVGENSRSHKHKSSKKPLPHRSSSASSFSSFENDSREASLSSRSSSESISPLPSFHDDDRYPRKSKPSSKRSVYDSPSDSRRQKRSRSNNRHSPYSKHQSSSHRQRSKASNRSLSPEFIDKTPPSPSSDQHIKSSSRLVRDQYSKDSRRRSPPIECRDSKRLKVGRAFGQITFLNIVLFYQESSKRTNPSKSAIELEEELKLEELVRQKSALLRQLEQS